MTHTEFLEKLRTFPPNEKARFYCPVNKTYYYICYLNFKTSTIELTLDAKSGYKGYEFDYASLIILLFHVLKKYGNKDIKFSYKDQTFIIL